MMKYPIQHGGGQNRITHHLCLLRDLLVGGEDDGGSLVGIANEGEEAVRLCSLYRGISDLINDDQLSLL